MEKIKFLTDSANDIPDDELEEYGIEMLCIPIAVDGVGYHERKDFSIDEYYSIITKAKEVPVTSKVPEWQYLESYKRAFEEGYTDIVTVTISSTGSATYESAVMARDAFYKENPDAKKSFTIHVVDSLIYTIVYGYAVVEAVKMARKGTPVAQIIAYLEDWFAKAEVYLGVYSLEFAKKSGRLSGMSAFVGEVLGLRPIISMIDGKSAIVDKVRGDKNVALRIFEAVKQNCADRADSI